MVLCGVWGLNSCRPAETPTPVTKDHPNNPKNNDPGNPKESVVIPVGINVDKSYENDKSVIDEEDLSYTRIPLVVTRLLKEHQNDEELGNGVHYRVLAYKKSLNGYTLEKNEDFVVGEDKKLNLNKNQKYTLIVYSFNNTTISPRPDNASDINNVSINYTNAESFLYYREEDYTPNKKDEKLKLKLRHQFAGIKIIIDEDIVAQMANITETKLTYIGINKAIFNLGNGKPTIESSNQSVVIDKLNFKGPRNSRESDWNYIILSPEEQELDFEGKVSFDKSTGGIVDLGKIELKIKVKGNARQTIKISKFTDK